jgi:hypothetical protein
MEVLPVRLRVVLLSLLVSLLAVPAAQARFRDKISVRTVQVWGFPVGVDCHSLPPGRFIWRIEVAGKARRVSYANACGAQNALGEFMDGATLRFGHFTARIGSRTSGAPAPVSYLEFRGDRHVRGVTKIEIRATIGGHRVFTRKYRATAHSIRRGWPKAKAKKGNGSGTGSNTNLGAGGTNVGGVVGDGGSCAGC